MDWVIDLQLENVYYEIDAKSVVHNPKHCKEDTSNFATTIILDCRQMLYCVFTKLLCWVNRQINEIAHFLRRIVKFLARSRIFSNVPTCIH